MNLYQLHYLDPTGALILKRAHAARQDLDALAEAERGSRTHTVEVWEGDRRVGRVKKGGIRSMARTWWGG